MSVTWEIRRQKESLELLKPENINFSMTKTLQAKGKVWGRRSIVANSTAFERQNNRILKDPRVTPACLIDRKHFEFN